MADIIRKVVGVFSFKDDASKQVDKIDKSMTDAKKSAAGLEEALKVVGGAKVVSMIQNFGMELLRAGADAETANVRLKNLSGEGYAELESAINSAAEASQGLAGQGDLEEAANAALKYGASVDFISKSMGDLQKMSAITGDSLDTMYAGLTKDIAYGTTKFFKSNAVLVKYIDEFKALGAGMDEATKQKREFFVMDAMAKEGIAIQQQYNEVMETTNGLLAVTNTQWGEVKERLGGIIAKGFKPFLKIANQVLTFLGTTEKGLIVLKLAAMAIAPVIGVILVGALYTAATAAWAFVAPLLPFIAIAALVGAAIAGLALVIEDFITWMNGGDSLLGDFFESVKKTLLQIWEIVKLIINPFHAMKVGVNFAMDKINGKASGGPVNAGTPYMVGEEGPELFVPSRSGSIVPNGAGAQIGALVNQLTINVSGPREAGEAVKTAVLNALNDLSRNVLRVELGMETV